MRFCRLVPAALVLLALLFALGAAAPAPRAQAAANDVLLDHWSLQWIDGSGTSGGAAPSPSGDWLQADADHAPTELPKGASGVWLRLDVPPTSDWLQPGLLASHMYGLDIAVYSGGKLLYETKRDNRLERNRLLLPLAVSSEPAVLDIRVLSNDMAGSGGAIRIGEIGELSNLYIRQGLPDLLFGAAIAFLGFVMLLCSGYLNRSRRAAWISLSLIALTTGCLFFCYSPLPYVYFASLGHVFLFLFDCSIVVLLPALNVYIRRVFERRHLVFEYFAKFQTGYAALCFLMILVYYATGERYTDWYNLFTVTLYGLLALVQMCLIVILAVLNAFKGQKDAILLSAGLLTVALCGAMDLIFYYMTDHKYVLFLWKIGVAAMFVSLVILFARRVSADYSILVKYSKELEMYNHRLQRSEKIKIIGDLAASVAHEVRNPLQVTRGFLQLLSRGMGEKEASYYHLAIQELDRASTIITDFLTFARPELDNIKPIDAAAELRSVESIIQPLAAMNGSELHLRLEEPLWIEGNSSKFKQAFINLIKNSIEALNGGGTISIEAYAEEHSAVIRVVDNGEGMHPEQLAKLGVPFFSTKTKGTGLGLMVTFRIIEVMRGTLEFRSERGKGTEAIVRFPLAALSSVPDAVHS